MPAAWYHSCLETDATWHGAVSTPRYLHCVWGDTAAQAIWQDNGVAAPLNATEIARLRQQAWQM